MHHENRQTGMRDDRVGHASEDRFSEPAVPVSAGDQQIAVAAHGGVEKHIGNGAISRFDQSLRAAKTVQRQIVPRIVDGRVVGRLVLDGEDFDGLGFLQKRQRRYQGMGSSLPAIPGDSITGRSRPVRIRMNVASACGLSERGERWKHDEVAQQGLVTCARHTSGIG